MQYVSCNLCGRDDAEPVSRGRDLLLDRPGDYRLVRCRHCGLIYQNPQLTLAELAAHYPEEYLPYAGALAAEPSRFRRLDKSYGLARAGRRVAHHRPEPGYLLDVGCATGLFLNMMRERGWQAAGVELNPLAADYARRTFGLEVQTGTLEDAAYPAATFDAVTLWDVLEHVVDPKGTLAEIGRVIKPGGLLVLGLPNPAGVEARLFGDQWVGWDRPRHLNLFTPQVLRRYLSEAGFRLESIESFSGRLGVTLLSVEFLCKARGIPEARWRPWLKLAYSPPLRVVSWPIYWLAQALNQTSTMTAFARLEPHES
jgi:SAM-dependent methyltransferase